MARSPVTVAGVIAALFVYLCLLPSMASAATVSFCSTENTGHEGQSWNYNWQSNGWCSDKCRGAYAFAVISYKDCWCSNYVPEITVSTGECDGTCPGYPTEICGSNSEDKFVYFAMGNRPSGTARGATKPTSTNVSPPSTPTSAPSSVEPSSAPPRTETTIPSSAPPPPVSTEDRQREPETVFQTVTASAPAASSESIPSPSSSSTLATTTSSTPPPLTSNRVITVSGQIVTETVVIPNPSTAPSLGETEQQKGSNVGAIAGGVVGGLVGLLAIVGGVFFFLWRRRRQQNDETEDGQRGVHRNVSTMSKSGLLRTEKPAQHPPPIATSFNKRNSRNMMQDADSVSPISGSDRRNSRPYLFDQRLNPSAIMTFDNTSQGSIVSMDDSRDYGRTLNVRNPDPEPRG